MFGLRRLKWQQIRIGELIGATSYIIARWDAKLSELSKNRLLKIREQLHLVHDLLGKAPMGELSPRDKTAVARFCREVPTAFVEEFRKEILNLLIDFEGLPPGCLI
ncbi:MAG TPA: hypothetical protein VN948_17440 [Terriglobales bacterium]|nr:hypothetical protein [Terriglobales bacterium]